VLKIRFSKNDINLAATFSKTAKNFLRSVNLKSVAYNTHSLPRSNTKTMFFASFCQPQHVYTPLAKLSKVTCPRPPLELFAPLNDNLSSRLGLCFPWHVECLLNMYKKFVSSIVTAKHRKLKLNLRTKPPLFAKPTTRYRLRVK